MILYVYKTEFKTKDKEFVFRFKCTTSRERKSKKPKNIHNSRINPKTDKRASNWPGKRSSSRSFLKHQLILLNSPRTHDTSKFLHGSQVSSHVSIFGFVSFLFAQIKSALLEITRQGNHKQFAIVSVIDLESRQNFDISNAGNCVSNYNQPPMIRHFSTIFLWFGAHALFRWCPKLLKRKNDIPVRFERRFLVPFRIRQKIISFLKCFLEDMGGTRFLLPSLVILKFRTPGTRMWIAPTLGQLRPYF